MFINYLLQNKKSRNSVIFKRKIVESYRAELVEVQEFQQHLHLFRTELNRLNRWYFKHRLQPFFYPYSYLKSMKKKDQSAYLKALERRLQDSERENQLLQLRAEVYETAIQIAEEHGADFYDLGK